MVSVRMKDRTQRIYSSKFLQSSPKEAINIPHVTSDCYKLTFLLQVIQLPNICPVLFSFPLLKTKQLQTLSHLFCQFQIHAAGQ